MKSVTAPFQIREARAEDLDQLCAFAEDFLTKLHADATVRDARRVFEQIQKAPELGVVLVAEHKEGLCGYAYAAYVWRAEFGGETMDLVALFVDEHWRKKGVGRSLVSSLIEIARQRKIRRISAEVRPENSAIERTLESGGFDPERRTLWGMRV